MTGNEPSMAAACSKKKIPLSLVLLDNIPTLLLFILGFLIIYRVSAAGAVLFGGYIIFSVVWFWARICPYCHHYNTLACPCGYGAISPKLFRKKSDKSFKKVFRRNIVVVFPNWFIPLAAALYLILTGYTSLVLALTVSFVLIGFVIIPLISKLVGCKNCEIREDCPWMNMKAGNVN
ncbi:MAG: hypothetical protein Q8868_08140 [Bacteroidota bacterium]|nr:hypothetical protein [Bacteroidota bacterium]